MNGMNLGSAIEWMMRNPGHPMRDLDGDHWHYDGEQGFVLTSCRPDTEPHDANILLPFLLQHRFTPVSIGDEHQKLTQRNVPVWEAIQALESGETVLHSLSIPSGSNWCPVQLIRTRTNARVLRAQFAGDTWMLYSPSPYEFFAENSWRIVVPKIEIAPEQSRVVEDHQSTEHSCDRTGCSSIAVGRWGAVQLCGEHMNEHVGDTEMVPDGRRCCRIECTELATGYWGAFPYCDLHLKDVKTIQTAALQLFEK